MENIFVEFLPPWVETGLQPAFYDKESGTVLQQTARMYARVNMLIRMFNKLSKQTKEEVERFEGVVNDTVEEYIEKFNDLHDYVHDYFDNLDVQEEINNKIDALVLDGTMQDIVNEVLQPAKVQYSYDNVASMVSDTNLVDGCFVETYGFYTKGDKGASKYKIRTVTAEDVVDGFTLITITGDESNTLVAELLPTNVMNAKQFGIVEYDALDPVDNKTRLEKAVAYGESVLNFDNKQYLTSLVEITESITVNGNNATLIINNGVNEGGVFNIKGTSNVNINNLTVKPKTHAFTQDGRGIQINSSTHVTIEGCKFQDMNGDGILVSKVGASTSDDTHHLYIRNNKFVGTNDGRNGISVLNGNNIFVDNNYFENVTKASMPGCFDIEPWQNNAYNFIHDIFFTNNKCVGNNGCMAMFWISLSNVEANNIVFSDNIMFLNDVEQSGGFIVGCPLDTKPTITNVCIKNNTVYGQPNRNRGIVADGCDNVTIEGNYLKNAIISLGGTKSQQNKPCDNFIVSNNTIFQDVTSTDVSTYKIVIRLKDGQNGNAIGNNICYVGNSLDDIHPFVFLSTTATPNMINVFSNTVSRTKATVANNLCQNYQPNRLGNVANNLNGLNND